MKKLTALIMGLFLFSLIPGVYGAVFTGDLTNLEFNEIEETSCEGFFGCFFNFFKQVIINPPNAINNPQTCNSIKNSCFTVTSLNPPIVYGGSDIQWNSAQNKCTGSIYLAGERLWITNCADIAQQGGGGQQHECSQLAKQCANSGNSPDYMLCNANSQGNRVWQTGYSCSVPKVCQQTGSSSIQCKQPTGSNPCAGESCTSGAHCEVIGANSFECVPDQAQANKCSGSGQHCSSDKSIACSGNQQVKAFCGSNRECKTQNNVAFCENKQSSCGDNFCDGTESLTNNCPADCEQTFESCNSNDDCTSVETCVSGAKKICIPLSCPKNSIPKNHKCVIDKSTEFANKYNPSDTFTPDEVFCDEGLEQIGDTCIEPDNGNIADNICEMIDCGEGLSCEEDITNDNGFRCIGVEGTGGGGGGAGNGGGTGRDPTTTSAIDTTCDLFVTGDCSKEDSRNFLIGAGVILFLIIILAVVLIRRR